MSTSPSVLKRDALRAALRAHPSADSVLNGRSVSNLPMRELIQAVWDCGLDADRIMSAAVAATPGQDAPQDAPDDGQDGQDSEDSEDGQDAPQDAPQDGQDAAAIEQEIAEIRGLILQGGFGALDSKLRDLITDARKPPLKVEVMVPVPTTGTSAGLPVVHAKHTGQEATWSKLFGVRGELGKRTTKLWDGAHPDTPKINARYVWPQPQTAIALAQIARGRNVLLYGPAGTGKTEWAAQLAARTGRPFALISCDASTDGPTLVGMTVPAADGAVAWQDGQMTRAIQTPGCVVCIDEPSVARPGALFVMQNMLANRVLYITETGQRVKVADGVVFIATDNTNGTGGGARKGFTDTNRLNAAFLDRFGVRPRFEFMPRDKEIGIICNYTGCTRELAALLVDCAATTRAAADNQTLTSGLGLRRLFSWAELLVDGIDPEDAFNAAILNCAPEQDVETLRQQCLLGYDKGQIAAALNPGAVAAVDPADSNPTAAGRSAAVDFRG